MKKQIKKQDARILESFLENSIPNHIKENSIPNQITENSVEKWDLMECYEELFNYSHGILEGKKIDINLNSFGIGKSFIFDKEYKNILLSILKNSDDLNLKIHCSLCLATLFVIKKYS